MKDIIQPLVVVSYYFLGTDDTALLCRPSLTGYFETTQQAVRTGSIVARVTDEKPTDRPSLSFTLTFCEDGSINGVRIGEKYPTIRDNLCRWFEAKLQDWLTGSRLIDEQKALYVSFSIDGVWLAVKEV